MPPAVDKPAQPRKRLALHWRIARHTLITILVLVMLVVVGAFLLLRNLDTSYIKTRLRNLARDEAGLDLDYSSAHVDVFSGIVLKGFTVAQPPELRAISPTLMQAGVIQLGWTLFGKGPMLRHFVASDVTLTIIVDDDGRTSLDTLGNKSKKKQEAPPSPGQELLALLRSIPEFDRLQLSPLTVDLLQTRAGRVRMRTVLEGLDLRAVSTGLDDDRAVEISLGEERHPLPVSLRRADAATPPPPVVTPEPPAKHKKGEHEERRARLPAAPQATGTLFVDGRLAAKVAHLKAELTVSQQTLDKEWPKKGVLFAVDTEAHSDGDALDVRLGRFEALAEAVVAKGALLVAPARARIDAAKGSVDLTRLARLVPAARLPLSLREGHTKYDVAGLDLDPTPRLDPGGHLDVEMHASGLRVGGEACAHEADEPPAPGCAALGRTTLDLDGVHLTLHGKPLAVGGLQLDAALPAATMTLLLGDGVKVALTRADTDVNATLPRGAPGKLDVRTTFATLATGGRLKGASARLDATGGSIDTRLTDLKLDHDHPARSSGALTSTVALGSLATVVRGVTARAEQLQLAVRGKVSDGEPAGVEVDSTIGRFTAQSGREVLVPPGPAQLSAHVTHLVRDKEVPLYSRGEVKLHAAIAQITLDATLNKLRDAVTFDLSVDAARAALLTAFAPPSLGLPARMAFTLKSKGRLDDLLAPRLKQAGSLHLEHAAVTIKEQTLAAETLDVALESDGNRRRQSLALTLRPHKLALDDEALGDGTLTLTGKWDESRPSFELALDGTGKALPEGHVQASFAWDKAERAVRYQIDGQLANLEALSPLLPTALSDEHWLDLTDLKAKLSSHGLVAGVITGFDRRGAPLFASNPLATLRGDDELHLEVESFHYVDAAGVELAVPSLALTTHVRSDGTRHHGEAELRIPDASIIAKKNKLMFHALVDTLVADLEGDPRSGPIDVTHRLSVGRMRQDVITFYPIGFITQETHARRTKEGTLQLDRFELDNGAAGTHLSAHGALTLARAIVRRDTVGVSEPVGFSSLGLSVAVTQQLDKLANPGRFAGSGSVALTAELMSGDLRRYHATATTRFAQASFRLPAQNVSVTHLDGTLPIVEDFAIERGQLRLFHAQQGNAYPQLRFSDQHPFLSGSGALSVEKIAVGDVDITDLVGNIRVARNQLAVDQLDAGMRGGRVAGQCLVDWRGADSTLSLRLRMTGIEARHKGAHERFDGNAALDLKLRERDLDGRIEVLRIGRQHLYDLLDEVDAHHKDAAINRVRSALELGYPDHVQVVFDRGFASMQVTFGGLARLFKIHEVRGIPTGPLVERYLGPLLSLESP